MQRRVIIIVGPTASGKTALAIALAKKLNGEVVSADSRQVYRGLDLGTGKVTPEEMAGVPHHLLDTVDPTAVYSAADFVRDAQGAIDAILARGKTPIIAGGTGFYIDALTGRMPLTPVSANPAFRASLAHRSAPFLFELLSAVDPKRAARMNESDSKNKVRLIRALEISYCGEPHEVLRTASPYTYTWIGIKPNMDALREKIGTRLDERLAQGMVEEARALHQKGISYERMEALGLEYRYLARYLQGDITLDAMRTQLEQKIWQYAKRQMTYWQRNKDIQWVTANYEHSALSILSAHT